MNVQLEALEKKYKELGDEIESLKTKEELWYCDDSIRYVVYADGACGAVANRVHKAEYYKQGNLFKASGEAVAESEYREAYVTVTQRIKELNDWWSPVWGGDQEKFGVILCVGKLQTYRAVSQKGQDKSMYLRCQALRDILIKELPEELMIVLSK